VEHHFVLPERPGVRFGATVRQGLELVGQIISEADRENPVTKAQIAERAFPGMSQKAAINKVTSYLGLLRKLGVPLGDDPDNNNFGRYFFKKGGEEDGNGVSSNGTAEISQVEKQERDSLGERVTGDLLTRFMDLGAIQNEEQPLSKDPWKLLKPDSSTSSGLLAEIRVQPSEFLVGLLVETFRRYRNNAGKYDRTDPIAREIDLGVFSLIRRGEAEAFIRAVCDHYGILFTSEYRIR